MKLNINQENLYLLLPGKIAWMTEMFIEDEKISIVEAIRKIYSSSVYKELEIESTKMWHLGPVDLYREFREDSSF